MFEDALEIILRSEGGYSNNPKDPGGETMAGITKRVAIEHGYEGAMRDLPMSVIEKIYRESYWDRISASRMPWAVALVVFDAAVNSGVKRASEWLQDVVQVRADGVIGDDTIGAIYTLDPNQIARDFCDVRLQFLKRLPTFGTFGKGWSHRVAETLAAAIG